MVLFRWLGAALRWCRDETLEKLNVVATYREIRDLGRKHGRRFFVAALLWEMVEDVLFPFLSVKAGYPALVPVFLVLHFEPVVYPMFFYAFRTWDRILGREPWEPDRLAMSTFWRTALKVLSHRMVSVVLFFLLLGRFDVGFGVLATYTVGMTLFAMVHDRIWHDSNFGIDVPSDQVSTRRIVLKACTYRAVSVVVMCGVFRALVGSIPSDVWAYQITTFAVGLVLSLWWASSPIGIRTVRSE